MEKYSCSMLLRYISESVAVGRLNMERGVTKKELLKLSQRVCHPKRLLRKNLKGKIPLFFSKRRGSLAFGSLILSS